MADNVVANAGSGGSTFAADDIGGVLYPRSKQTWGPDGTSNDVDVASGKALPIQIRSSGGTELATGAAPLRTDPTGTTAQPISDAGGTVSIDDGAGSITIDGSVTATSGTAANFKAQVQGEVAHDGASSGNPVLLGAYASAAAPTDVSADGDVVRLWADKAGRIQVGDGGLTLSVDDGGGNLSIDDGGGSITVDGTVAVSGSVAVTGTFWQATQPVSGTFWQATQPISIAAALPAGTNAIGKLAANSGVDIGDVDITSVPADPFGVNADAASATGSISAKLRFIASTGIPITGTVTVGSHAVTNAGTFAVQAGQAAHDAAVSGSPVRIAGRGRTSDYTAVVNDDTTDFITDLNGKQVTLPYAIPENTIQGATAAITDTTNTSVIASAGGSLRNYITHVLVTNSHATVGTVVEIRDGATTVLYRGYAAPVGGGFALHFPVPLRGTAATAITASCITTGSNVYVSACGFKAI